MRARHDAKGHQYLVTIEEEHFHLSATQTSELRHLVERTVVAELWLRMTGIDQRGTTITAGFNSGAVAGHGRRVGGRSSQRHRTIIVSGTL